MNKFSLKQSLLVVLGLSANILAQNSTYNYTQHNAQCWGCVTAVPTAGFYCFSSTVTNGINLGVCQAARNTNAGWICGNTQDFCMDNPMNVLSGGDVVISQLDIIPIRNLTIRNGTTLKFTVKSQAEKSGFISLGYQDESKKSDTRKVLFYVYNNRLQTGADRRRFEMSHVNEVLLPHSDDTYTVFLASQKSDFNITLTKSNALYIIAGISTMLMGLISMLF
ncbi:UNKNOWN [Stylonychia lemnae]|uniref:Uncharacterized protein n=1 Tax=Stylonychia lemnae TaxID=5949 RepID=A0A078A1Q7_STYLE|nr:UNKNOWN [Stylonychia lemnae]|eukprot:CDW75398.1 UNKNOWN [Stylonychia lemnae]